MKKYIQYPTPTLNQTSQLKAPIIPFTVSFTIDGINGFRYGDLLSFKGLPARYTSNTVFMITTISQNVSSEGAWNTTINAVMRTKIDFE